MSFYGSHLKRLAEEVVDRIETLERERAELESINSELEDRLEKILLNERIETLEDEFMFRAFAEYRKNYTAWEFEELMKNGKDFLKDNGELIEILKNGTGR